MPPPTRSETAPCGARPCQPPPALAAFLAQGEPPVYVGFGSMGGHNPAQVAELVVAALAQAQRRGVLLTGWGGMAAQAVPDSIFVLDAAPHSWLFPRMAAVVHHGGAGTTAEGLRAGVPTVIVPFIVDQPFWGKRVEQLGVGPSAIPHKRLTVDQLAHAIHRATTDTGMQQRAAALGRALRAERGVEQAVSLVQHYLRAEEVQG